MEFGFSEIKSLSEMLKSSQQSDSDSEDDLPRSRLSKLGPSHIGCPASSGNAPSTDASKEESSDGNAIWSPTEVPDDNTCDDTTDPRQRPEYDIKYRQAVTPEDVYLQMSGRTTSTTSCEDLVVSIPLPGETFSAVDLSVTRSRLDVRSPHFRLGLPLPHSVDPNSSCARWDEQTETLVVTLRMVREFDFVNF